MLVDRTHGASTRLSPQLVTGEATVRLFKFCQIFRQVFKQLVTYRLDDVQALDDGAKDDVLSVQPRCLGGAQKELRSVSSGSGVGHGQGSGSGVLQLEVLVGKLGAVDGLASGSVVVGEVATLAHEPGNDPVENNIKKKQSLHTAARMLLVRPLSIKSQQAFTYSPLYTVSIRVSASLPKPRKMVKCKTFSSRYKK